jgi:serine/threonine protein kinase
MKTCPTCQAGFPTSFAVCPQDGTPLVEVGAWSPGAVVRGKYRILSKIGQGGMGAVYKALHVTFDELRAIKVISPELIHDQLFVKRFKHEAVITRKLQHPNAVRVDDIDEAEDGRPFIVMEFIEGQSLRKLIEDHGAMPVERACSIIKQSAAALDAAHRLGMVHRDIKPDNIVLVETPEGEQAKVLDFGIAKLKEGRTGEMGGMTLTGTGVVIGTPQYMSPEQAMGRRGDQLDGRSDLYSLGIVMYQMLTGELPFRADTTMEMLIAHLQQPPINVRAVRPELQIPAGVANVVMRLLAKKPEDRPANAMALIVEIEQAESDWSGAAETHVISPVDLYDQPINLPAAPAPPSRPMARASRATAAATAAATPPPEPPRRVATPPPPPSPQPRPPVEPRRAAPPPPQVRVPPPPAARAKKPSQVGIWAALFILGFGLAGGVWYFTERPSAPSSPQNPLDKPGPTGSVSTTSAGGTGSTSRTEPTPQPASQTPAERVNPLDAAGGSTTPSRPALASRPASQPATGSRTTAPSFVQPPARQPAPEVVARPQPEPPPAKPAVDSKKVSAAIKMGEFYFDRGEYEKAIEEFQQGLTLDPSNQDLRMRITRARRAKAAEDQLNQ